MTYPAPPGPPAPYGPQGPVRRRGKVPLILGIVLLVLGVVAVVVGAVALAGSVKRTNDLQRVKVDDRTGTVKFTGTGKYVAYYEADNVNSNISKVPLVGVVLTSPSGKRIVVDTTYGNKSDGKIKKYTYDSGSHHGAALYQFDISEKGTYQVALTPNSNDGPNATIAFGRDLSAGLVGGVLGIGAGVVLGLIGLVLLIVGLVKRSRSKPSALAGPPGYAGSPGYGAAPYGAPQGGYPSAGGYQSQPGHQTQPGAQPPAYGNQPPTYGQQPPTYGNQPPTYGQQPPSSGPDLTKRDQSGEPPQQSGYWS